MLESINSATLLGVGGHPVPLGGPCSQRAAGLRSSGPTRRFVQRGPRPGACSACVERPHVAVTADNRQPGTTGVLKAGAVLDLAMAVGLLVACGELEPEAVYGLAFLGELGLDGSIRPVAGAHDMVSVAGPVDGLLAG